MASDRDCQNVAILHVVAHLREPWQPPILIQFSVRKSLPHLVGSLIGLLCGCAPRHPMLQVKADPISCDLPHDLALPERPKGARCSHAQQEVAKGSRDEHVCIQHSDRSAQKSAAV